MTPVTIREMRPEDVDEVIRIVCANEPELEQDARQEIGSPPEWLGCRYFVAETDGAIRGVMGYCGDRWGAPGVMWSVWLFVHPDYHRRGIATLLYQRIEAELRRAGCRKAYLDVGNADTHASAIAFHVRNGYKLEGTLEDYWGDGEDCLLFGKPLNDNPGRQQE